MLGCRKTAVRVLLVWSIFIVFPSSSQAGWLFQPGIGGSLTDVGSGLGGAFLVKLRGYWLPVPEVGIGLHADFLFPLPSVNAEGEHQVDAVLMAGPALILRFGNDSAWGFVRTGLYGSAFLSSDLTESALSASAGGGFVVAPRTMPFHFGFELEGTMGLAGNGSLMSIGLGAFIGWTL